jgi:CrcB protein
VSFNAISLFWVALGGAAGSVLRYLIATLVQSQSSSGFPFGTLTVNVIGCLIIGVFVGLSMTKPDSMGSTSRLLLATGFCGGFTTFSAFSAETIALLDKGDIMTAVLYVAVSVGIGLLATLFGILLARSVITV